MARETLLCSDYSMADCKIHNMEKKAIVVSAVSLAEGGGLTIISSVLEYLDGCEYADQFRIYGLVHSKELFRKFSKIELIEYPHVRLTWLNRIKFEYSECLKISRELDTYLWLSMHDVTPNTEADRRAVYCHNASPFYQQPWQKFFKSPLRYLYTKYYKELYRINIKKNDFVIVQQQWMREEFLKMFNLPAQKVVVSLPAKTGEEPKNVSTHHELRNNFLYFYPAFPREFKNIEVICEAAVYLSELTSKPFKIVLTLDGSENDYSREIYAKFSKTDHIEFTGLLSKAEVVDYYQKTDCLLFPSLLESWGLPISEFKVYQKPILAASLPYAYETVGDYEKIAYFDPRNPRELAKLMNDVLTDQLEYNGKGAIRYAEPVCHNWNELFKLLIK